MSTARNRYPGMMNSDVSPEKGRSTPSPSLALSTRRSDVVPAATIRPPRRRVSLISCAAAAPGGDIGRQRHVAAFLYGLVEHGTVEGEGQNGVPALRFLLDGRVELTEEADLTLVAETDDVADRRFPRGF